MYNNREQQRICRVYIQNGFSEFNMTADAHRQKLGQTLDNAQKYGFDYGHEILLGLFDDGYKYGCKTGKNNQGSKRNSAKAKYFRIVYTWII